MRRYLTLALLLAVLAWPAGGARAADPAKTSPLEVIGYVLYPLGFALDRVVFGTFRWLGRTRPVQFLLGLEPDPRDLEADAEGEPSAPPVAEGAASAGRAGESAESAAAPAAAAGENPAKKR